VAAGSLVISGTVVHVGGRRVELSGIEAQLLAVLAQRAGAVVSKDDLLREVWRDPDGDPHVVEVAVARLRRRLGPAGTAVATVVRRGYALR
jgi:uroporphyrinogen-III synthase